MTKNIYFITTAIFLLTRQIYSCTPDLAQDIQNCVNFGECRSFSFQPPRHLQIGEKEFPLSFVTVFPCHTEGSIYVIGNIRENTHNAYEHEREDFLISQSIIAHPSTSNDVRPIRFGTSGSGFRTNETLVFLGDWRVFFDFNPFPNEGLSSVEVQRLTLERFLQMGQSTRMAAQ